MFKIDAYKYWKTNVDAMTDDNNEQIVETHGRIHVLKCGDRSSGRRPRGGGIWEGVPLPVDDGKCLILYRNGTFWCILSIFHDRKIPNSDTTRTKTKTKTKNVLMRNRCPVLTFC